MITPTLDQALKMGRFGPNMPPELLEAERLAFEAWMEGHCWLVARAWNGTTYDDRPGVPPGCIDSAAMHTQIAWAAWRDRAALAHLAAGGEASHER
jgi:hypothetical protein